MAGRCKTSPLVIFGSFPILSGKNSSFFPTLIPNSYIKLKMSFFYYAGKSFIISMSSNFLFSLLVMDFCCLTINELSAVFIKSFTIFESGLTFKAFLQYSIHSLYYSSFSVTLAPNK